MINPRLFGVDGALLDDTREFGAWADGLGADRLADLDAATTILQHAGPPVAEGHK